MGKEAIILTWAAWAAALSACGQEARRWSVQAGLGGVTMMDNRYDDGRHYVNEDQGNVLYLSADRWLGRRTALTGGVVWEQQGVFTDYADGIGLKKVTMLGVQAGAKYYFLPTRWVVQPHVGASLLTNVLHLGRERGETLVVTQEGYPGCHALLASDVQCPALSLSPRVGVDIHLLSSVSLCVDYDWRIGLWGSNRGTLRFTDGPLMGQALGVNEPNRRTCVSLGLKVDLPVQPVSSRAGNNLFRLLYGWVASKAGR